MYEDDLAYYVRGDNPQGVIGRHSIYKCDLTEFTSLSGKTYYRYTYNGVDEVVSDEDGEAYSYNDPTAPFNDLDGDGISNDADSFPDDPNNGAGKMSLAAFNEMVKLYFENFGAALVNGEYWFETKDASGNVVYIKPDNVQENDEYYFIKGNVYEDIGMESPITPENEIGISIPKSAVTKVNGTESEILYLFLAPDNVTWSIDDSGNKQEYNNPNGSGSGSGSGSGGSGGSGSGSGGNSSGGGNDSGSGSIPIGDYDPGNSGNPDPNNSDPNDNNSNNSDPENSDPNNSDSNNPDPNNNDPNNPDPNNNDPDPNDSENPGNSGSGNEGNGGTTIIIGDENDSGDEPTDVGPGEDWFPMEKLVQSFERLRQVIELKLGLDIGVFTQPRTTTLPNLHIEFPSFFGIQEFPALDISFSEIKEKYHLELVRTVLLGFFGMMFFVLVFKVLRQY